MEVVVGVVVLVHRDMFVYVRLKSRMGSSICFSPHL